MVQPPACLLAMTSPQWHVIYHAVLTTDTAATVDMIEAASSAAPPLQLLNRLSAPRWLFRTVACLVLGGQVVARICRGGLLLPDQPAASMQPGALS
jgi:hypothetical protein